MPATLKPMPFQTICDLSLQETGTVESCFEFAVANGVSITSHLDPNVSYINAFQKEYHNQELQEMIEQYNKVNEDGYHPATAVTEALSDCEGIGCWVIGIDFIIIP